MATAKRNRVEEREQARVVRWSHLQAVRAVAPELRWLHHSPNGGRRDGFTGAQMVALGVKRGWPDLVLPVPGGGLAIEMKAEDGRVSAEQSDWLAHLAACGWTTAVCRSAEDARVALLRFLGICDRSAPELPS